jgi:hypothetical protein
MGGKMKKLLLVIICIFIISGCAPSQADIERAIEQTQTAMPTPTPTLTNTPQPTLTPTPIIPLRQLVITKKDINDTFPGFYDVEITEVELPQNNDSNITDSFAGFFAGSRGAGNISIIMARFISSDACDYHAKALQKVLVGNSLSFPSIKMPSDAYMIYQLKNSDVVLVFCQSTIEVVLSFALTQGATGNDAKNVVAVIGQKQYFKLQDAGY